MAMTMAQNTATTIPTPFLPMHCMPLSGYGMIHVCVRAREICRYECASGILVCPRPALGCGCFDACVFTVSTPEPQYHMSTSMNGICFRVRLAEGATGSTFTGTFLEHWNHFKAICTCVLLCVSNGHP
jgi:hypothetical protein